MFDRRSLLLSAPALLLATTDAGSATQPLMDLEKRHGGRLGVAALDVGTGKMMGHRANERFAMCSTFKLLLMAAVLDKVDEGNEHLDRQVSYGKADLLPHAPITEKHVAEGQMSVSALCEAVATDSDNGAANLLLKSVGGPPAVTAFARSLGDSVTRLDRTEMTLNDVAPGDERDTTTPAAMVTNLHALALGNALSPDSRAQLIRWLKSCKTGLTRLRAGLPQGWAVGDKTGTGFRAETNDVAIAWPPARPPIIVAAYYCWSKEPDGARDAVLADVARIVTKTFA